MLVHKRRISLFEPINTFLNSIAQIRGLNLVQISPSIAADSCSLIDFHGDPADRLIIASAREIAGTLVTRDGKILTWARAGYVKIIRG